MKECLKNWNYGKHACAVTSLYLTISIIGNLLMGTPKKFLKMEGKSLSKRVNKLTKKEKIFNLGVTGCFIFDMTATYGILKLIQRKLANN